MAKTWDKETLGSAYIYLQNGMYFKLEHIHSGEWVAFVMLRGLNSNHEIMSWEWEGVHGLERAKELAYSALKTWVTDFAESI